MATYLEEHEGCSWGQFIKILALFFARQVERIGHVAFGIGSDPGGKPIVKVPNYAHAELMDNSEIMYSLEEMAR